MALGAVLVDRARILEKREARERVEGTTRYHEAPGPWFRARLFLSGDADGFDSSRGHKRAVRRPRLMCAVRDSERGLIELGFDKRLEVDSPQLGRHIWRITGEPEPLRKRRTVIGWQVTLERVERHDRAEHGSGH